MGVTEAKAWWWMWAGGEALVGIVDPVLAPVFLMVSVSDESDRLVSLGLFLFCWVLVLPIHFFILIDWSFRLFDYSVAGVVDGVCLNSISWFCWLIDRKEMNSVAERVN